MVTTGLLWENFMKDKTKQYCPFCCREIEAANIEEVDSGERDGYIFAHDAVPHDDDYDFNPDGVH